MVYHGLGGRPWYTTSLCHAHFEIFFPANAKNATMVYHKGRWISATPIPKVRQPEREVGWGGAIQTPAYTIQTSHPGSLGHARLMHTSGHSGMKSDFCMSETREPEHMKRHLGNCMICTFWACLLRHESGVQRSEKPEDPPPPPLEDISGPGLMNFVGLGASRLGSVNPGDVGGPLM